MVMQVLAIVLHCFIAHACVSFDYLRLKISHLIRTGAVIPRPIVMLLCVMYPFHSSGGGIILPLSAFQPLIFMPDHCSLSLYRTSSPAAFASSLESCPRSPPI